MYWVRHQETTAATVRSYNLVKLIEGFNGKIHIQIKRFKFELEVLDEH